MRTQGRHWFARVGLLGVLGGPVLAMCTTFAAASSPPPDPALVGSLTLCNSQGDQVTTGTLTTEPAFARAVSASAAPQGYDKNGTSTLYAFQPRPGVPPEEWSGEQLTASSRYSDADHPVAVGTTLDESIATYLHDYPLATDGVFELRSYLGAPGLPQRSTAYDGSYLQVSNGSWTQLDAGPNDCASAGDAVSLETLTLPRKSFKKAHSADPATGRGGSITSSSQTRGRAGGGSGGGTVTAPDVVPRAESTSTSHAGRNLLVVVVVAAGVGIGGVAMSLRRRS